MSSIIFGPFTLLGNAHLLFGCSGGRWVKTCGVDRVDLRFEFDDGYVKKFDEFRIC